MESVNTDKKDINMILKNTTVKDNIILKNICFPVEIILKSIFSLFNDKLLIFSFTAIGPLKSPVSFNLVFTKKFTTNITTKMT